jgi:hypothetical protein
VCARPFAPFGGPNGHVIPCQHTTVDCMVGAVNAAPPEEGIIVPGGSGAAEVQLCIQGWCCHVCVCERERERGGGGREKESERERERERVCVCVCMSKTEGKSSSLYFFFPSLFSVSRFPSLGNIRGEIAGDVEPGVCLERRIGDHAAERAVQLETRLRGELCLRCDVGGAEHNVVCLCVAPPTSPASDATLFHGLRVAHAPTGARRRESMSSPPLPSSAPGWIPANSCPPTGTIEASWSMRVKYAARYLWGVSHGYREVGTHTSG